MDDQLESPFGKPTTLRRGSFRPSVLDNASSPKANTVPPSKQADKRDDFVYAKLEKVTESRGENGTADFVSREDGYYFRGANLAFTTHGQFDSPIDEEETVHKIRDLNPKLATEIFGRVRRADLCPKNTEGNASDNQTKARDESPELKSPRNYSTKQTSKFPPTVRPPLPYPLSSGSANVPTPPKGFKRLYGGWYENDDPSS